MTPQQKGEGSMMTDEQIMALPKKAANRAEVDA